VPEARLEDSGSGLTPAEAGWFVVNVRDAGWRSTESFGSDCKFEGKAARFEQLGINISVIEPGQPNTLYHSEGTQEDFLVLSGQCTLLIDGEERHLEAWDFVHVPAGTEHAFVGAGDEPCVVLMAGVREQPEHLLYPKSELAERYGASAKETTPDPDVAYAGYEEPERVRPSYWERLPWNRQI
jgi:uncharacterized cupin superfamily protein